MLQGMEIGDSVDSTDEEKSSVFSLIWIL